MSSIQIETRNASETLDVRVIAPRDRHLLIFRSFDRLAPGQAFVLVNDHDPKPLYYQFQAEQPGKVRWEYLEQGPDVWRVRIGRMLDLATTPILELMTAYPRIKDILDNSGLDTCCGAHMTVSEAAAAAGVDSETVLNALHERL
jgi:uncharacterized protein (DUF2249 family)